MDVALLAPEGPWVFIEVKAVGMLEANLPSVETQMRDYNRNLTAMFSIATDGQIWKFYYSQTKGDFGQKLFKELDLLRDDPEDTELVLRSFLEKERVQNGSAESDAKEYLRLNQKQRSMDDALPHARRMISEPPFPSLPDALAQLVSAKGHKTSREEAVSFIAQHRPETERSNEPRAQVTVLKELYRRRPHRSTAIGRANESLSQIIDVCLAVYKGHRWVDAVRMAAETRDVHVGTIRDKCTRQLGLNTDDFLLLIKDKAELKRRLNERFPGNAGYLDAELGQ